jgi:DNA primase
MAPYQPPPPPQRPEEKRAQFLMAILINHPALFEEIEETIASVTFVTAPLDTLRDAVVRALSRSSGLDANSLTVHLREDGFSETLENILSEATYNHAPFARPEASLDDARRAWRDILGGAWHSTISREVRGAGDEFKQDESATTFARLLALTAEARRRTAETSQALDDDPDLDG